MLFSLLSCNDRYEFELHSELSQYELNINEIDRIHSATLKTIDLMEMNFNAGHYTNMYYLTEQDKYRIMANDLIKKHIPKLAAEIKQLEEKL